MDDDAVTPDELGVAPNMPKDIPATGKRTYTGRGAYPDEFRDKAVRMVIEDGMSTSEVAEQLKLRRPTVTTWVREAGHGKKNRKILRKSTVHHVSLPVRPPVDTDPWEASLINEQLAQMTLEIEMLKKMLMLYMNR